MNEVLTPKLTREELVRRLESFQAQCYGFTISNGVEPQVPLAVLYSWSGWGRWPTLCANPRKLMIARLDAGIRPKIIQASNWSIVLPFAKAKNGS
jgi:hypothetical protein